jgi:threonylcarbamoyladenosine tRNA methylthiotransferase CDKAL1
MTSVCFITQGCSANRSDTEVMAGLLKEAKFEIFDTVEDSDIIIFNTCTVKNPSESAFFRELEKIKIEYPYKVIVIAGCIAQSDPTHPILKNYCLIGTRQIHKIVEVVEEALNENIVHLLEKGEMPPLNLPRLRKNPIVGIVQINLGCLGACTFCKTKSARFTLKSYPIDEIVQEVQTALTEGVKEIWLTSQDAFCYGFDIGVDITKLLREIVKLPGDFKIRVGMGNPDHLPRIQEGLIDIYKHPKIFKFLHLPLQSGNNIVLKDMKRAYTVEEFDEIIRDFRKAIPEINIMTDIIVGYPTEDENQFFDTLNVVRRHSFDSINISRFWPRPGTPAAKLTSLHGDVVKHRSSVLTDIFHNISFLQNEKWVGWKGKVLVDEKGKEGQWIARNYAYKPVILEGDFNLGDIINVEIVKVERFALIGRV